MQELPFDFDLESRTVLKSLPQAHAALAELKGVAATIPNQNILYLVLQGLQNLPILYLSCYIIRNKDQYYRLLQSVRETIVLINQMKNLMQEYKTRIREHYKFYSQDLLNNLFRHPYTNCEVFQFWCR